MKQLHIIYFIITSLISALFLSQLTLAHFYGTEENIYPTEAELSNLRTSNNLFFISLIIAIIIGSIYYVTKIIIKGKRKKIKIKKKSKR